VALAINVGLGLGTQGFCLGLRTYGLGLVNSTQLNSTSIYGRR